ncbi:Probable ubiquitin-conjugating enzyme E2 W-B [Seminavis robusta]|uniref:Probable ubiquitin-conjugating enzyme E2 W-B n=1 Tax=Seminavis robusta TaxID=568900 RepID=A0A9N8EEA1_9STRA|nr:Probable ubiquitin-conjugating enzyme E2 W-B [Seminavis robusta]|eukprot:Sro965_g225660.1 Probable ubiquitin-conjugating enzyme E2 W-B (343) ;mRNA; f:39326-40456
MAASLYHLSRQRWRGLVLAVVMIGCLVGTSKAASNCPINGGSSVPILHRSISSLSTRQQPYPILKPAELDILFQLRGGADDDEDDGISLDETTSASPIMSKLRNVIRSVLQIGDRKIPIVSTGLKAILGGLENILGVELLPKKKKKKAKKAGKKNKKKKAAKEEGDTEEEDDKPKETSKKQPSAATKKHLVSKLSATNPNYRIQRELKEFIQEPPPNLSVKVGKNIRVWIVTMIGAKNTIYEGEVYKLRVSFPPQYPTMPPSVYFLPPNIPKHEHVYTNGDICLSLLGKDWRPTMTAQSIANSILSILSSAQSKSIPMDNAKHAQNKPGQYQEDWVYHDDNC